MGNYEDFCKETFFKEIAVLKKEGGKFTPKSIDMKEHTGVWIMWGKKRENDDYTCLEVGQNQEIINELNENISYITKELMNNNEENVYPSKRTIIFPGFSRIIKRKNNEKARQSKYRQIAEEFDEIKIFEDLSVKDKEKEERMIEEGKIACMYLAVYWFPFGNKQWNQVYIARERIKNKQFWKAISKIFN